MSVSKLVGTPFNYSSWSFDKYQCQQLASLPTTESIRSQPIPVSTQPPYLLPNQIITRKKKRLQHTSFLVFINTKFQISSQSSQEEEGLVQTSDKGKTRLLCRKSLNNSHSENHPIPYSRSYPCLHGIQSGPHGNYQSTPSYTSIKDFILPFSTMPLIQDLSHEHSRVSVLCSCRFP